MPRAIARAQARAFFSHLIPGLVLLALLAAVAGLQWPALSGGFLFDDEPNLRDLGTYGGVSSAQTLRAYLESGLAGPTGRPLALLSFLIDDFTWPAPPGNFKRTNLLLHLLNIALLAWASYKLTRFYGLRALPAAWSAVLAAGLWGMHPFLVSTTFYVVQRMAMLPATFIFAALAAYLHGRMMLASRPRAAWLWMALALFLGTLCATLSKENGALLPLFILVIEACAPAAVAPLPRAFRFAFLYLPSAALLAYLLSHLNFSTQPWPERGFSQTERLLTETRILWDYLGQWFLPRIEGAGLFRDGIELSRSLWQPLQTLPAALGLLGLLIAAWRLRRRAPYLALGVLFFLTGHLVESSWLSLELYFEHRNYLPSAFLLLPLVVWGVTAYARGRRALVIALFSAIALELSFFAHQRALLWANPVTLETYWALAAPESPRAAHALARNLANLGEPERADAVLGEALARRPDSGLLLLSRMQLRLNQGKATPDDAAETARRLAEAPFDAQTVQGLRHLVERAARPGAAAHERQIARQLVESLQSNPRYAQFPLFRRLTPYLLGLLALADGMVDDAQELFSQAAALYGDVDATLQMMAELGNTGHPAHALRLLAQAEAILASQSEQSLKFPRSFYQQEITRIRGLLEGELADKSHGSNPHQATGAAR